MLILRTLAALLLLTASMLVQTQVRAQEALTSNASSRNELAAKNNPKSPRARTSATVDVEQIFERFFEAQGGVHAMAKVRTRIMRATISHSMFNTTGNWEYYAKAPNKVLSVMKVPSGAQFIGGYDGSDGWIQTPFAAAIQIDPDSAVVLDRSSEFVRKKASEMYSSLTYKGRSKLAGREMHVVQAGRKGDAPQTLYFDVANGLLARADILLPCAYDRKTAYVSLYFDRYAEVDGITLPVIIRNVYEAYTLTFTIYEIKHNVEISDAMFSQPKSSPPPK